jgi:histidinol phosphatase-like PHP family hydrolase
MGAECNLIRHFGKVQTVRADSAQYPCKKESFVSLVVPATTILETQDTHVHTFRSSCGLPECTPKAVLERFQQLHFQVVCITDHRHLDTDPALFQETCADLLEIETPLDVYVGCEAEVLSPEIVSLPDWEADIYDVILLAASHYHVFDQYIPRVSTPRQMAEWVLALHRRAASKPWADIIPHPFSFTETLGPWGDAAILESIRDDELIELADMAKSNSIAIEFRLGHALSPAYRELLLRFTKICVRRGVLLSSGSDAHSLDAVGITRTFLVPMRTLGIQNKHFVDIRTVVRNR